MQIRQPATASGMRRTADIKALIGLAAFTGLTAAPCGVALMARPDGALLQVAPSALEELRRNSPFPDFLIPGAALTTVGGAMLAAAVLVTQDRPAARAAALIAGGALVIFEVVEYLAIGYMPLQLFESLVGLLVVAIAARMRTRAGPRR